jgi:hypothetical protein
VYDDSPEAESRYRARFNFDPNGIYMPDMSSIQILNGRSGSTAVLVVEMRIINGEYQVRVLALTDGGTWRIGSYFPISDGEHTIELDWQAATAEGADDGYLSLWIDGGFRSTLMGIDNDTRRIERGMLGAIAGVNSTTNGTLYFDAFESRRAEYIEP